MHVHVLCCPQMIIHQCFVLRGLGVVAAQRVAVINDLGDDRNTSAVACRLANTCVDPDTPGVSARASDETGTTQVEVAGFINGPASELSILRGVLAGADVAQFTLAYVKGN